MLTYSGFTISSIELPLEIEGLQYLNITKDSLWNTSRDRETHPQTRRVKTSSGRSGQGNNNVTQMMTDETGWYSGSTTYRDVNRSVLHCGVQTHVRCHGSVSSEGPTKDRTWINTNPFVSTEKPQLLPSHSVEGGRVKGVPEEREVETRREVCEWKGWMCVREEIGASSHDVKVDTQGLWTWRGCCRPEIWTGSKQCGGSGIGPGCVTHSQLLKRQKNGGCPDEFSKMWKRTQWRSRVTTGVRNIRHERNRVRGTVIYDNQHSPWREGLELLPKHSYVRHRSTDDRTGMRLGDALSL